MLRIGRERRMLGDVVCTVEFCYRRHLLDSQLGFGGGPLHRLHDMVGGARQPLAYVFREVHVLHQET